VKTWVFGHRGDSANAPENTLAAFDRALRGGADGIELDVHISSDGVPVVIHDDWLERTTGVPGSVRNSTLADLKALDAGSWFSPAFAGERIPTLAEVLELCRNRGIVNIEVKSESRTPIAPLCDAVIRVVEAVAHPEQLLISSFDPRVLRRITGRAPALSAAFLRSYTQRGPWRTLGWWSRARFFDVDAPLASAAAARAGGWDRVLVWTVDEAAEQERLFAQGVRGLITNHPAEARARRDALAASPTGAHP
jgi:glycerophosphoryl diester phosphodiesterase